jgi:hypothetical protein
LLRKLENPEKRVALSVEAIVVFFAEVIPWIPKMDKYSWKKMRSLVCHSDFFGLFSGEWVSKVPEENYRSAQVIHELNEEMAALAGSTQLSEVLLKQVRGML